MAAEEQEALREFMAVMGTEEERARFVLETAGWDLQVAPRGGPLRAGWGMRSAASALRPKRTVIRAGLGPAWPRPHGVWGRLPRVSGLAWKFMHAGGPGLLFRASVFRRARSVSETLGAAAVCVESSPGDVAAAASACGWPGGIECPASRWSPTEVAVAFQFRFCKDAVLVGETLQGISPRPTLA